MRIFITVKDIESVHCCARSTAWNHLQVIKEALGKKRYQKVLIREFLEYEGMKLEDFQNAIKNSPGQLVPGPDPDSF